jgi:hypothetical protein
LPTLLLPGLRAEPLTGYLGALGVLCLLHEQADPKAQGCWGHDGFQISSKLDSAALVDFFLHRYQPAPIAAPWNSGSGFYDPSPEGAITRIQNSQEPRLAHYRRTLATISQVLTSTGCTDGPTHKLELLKALKAKLPPKGRRYLDTVLTIDGDDVEYHSLFLTGGNDGRLEFSRNFMERIVLLLLDGDQGSESLLNAALFDQISEHLEPVSLGVHSPGSVGADSPGPGSLSNPWSAILAMEGSLLLRGGRCKTVYQAAPGTSALPKETYHRDLTLPLWVKPLSCPEVQRRLRQTDHQSFIRYSFLRRNGQSYFAVPFPSHSKAEVKENTSTEAGCAQSLAGLGNETMAPLDLDSDFTGYNLPRRMLRLLHARARQAETVSKVISWVGYPLSNAPYASAHPTPLGHIEAFIHGHLDDSLIERLFRAHVGNPPTRQLPSSHGFLPYPYALCKLAFHQFKNDRRPVRIEIAQHLAQGRTGSAMAVALDFLLPRHPELPVGWPSGPPLDHATSERWAAALLFPISDDSYHQLLAACRAA